MKKYLTLEQCQEAKSFLLKIDASMEYIQYKDLEVKYYKDPGTWVYSEVYMVPKNTNPKKSQYHGQKIILAPCWSLDDLMGILDFHKIEYRVEFDGENYLVRSGMDMFEDCELINCVYELIKTLWQRKNK
jgi:hypothetical protein